MKIKFILFLFFKFIFFNSILLSDEVEIVSDNIKILDNGKVIENGKHQDLLYKSIMYKNFYEKQIQK